MALFPTNGQVFISAAIGFLLVALTLRSKPSTPVPPVNDTVDAAPGAQAVEPAPAAPPAKPVHAEADIVALLALLQQEGRLIDFIQEDISKATDAQLGPVARVVHSGCRKVVQQYIKIEPVSSAAEGSVITLAEGYDPAEYRLLGKVSGNPPYTGSLLHAGWKVVNIQLPEVVHGSDKQKLPVLAPAELELGNR
ncbi:MAG: DUF2760 domain-containing protein [Verrucomicrobia bacterium]|nr:DUF2760 domain-containing protein [Verrucomicrobiota bacterium]